MQNEQSVQNGGGEKQGGDPQNIGPQGPRREVLSPGAQRIADAIADYEGPGSPRPWEPA